MTIDTHLEVKTTPPDLVDRMRRYERVLDGRARKTMESALLAVQEKVPSYPVYSSPYRRTGELGRSLGASQSGGVAGQPDIKLVRKLGTGNYEGQFGSRVSYAQYVIGEHTQARHMGHWWTMKTIARRARRKIERLFNELSESLARYLEGQG
jgi:hypothetical protein